MADYGARLLVEERHRATWAGQIGVSVPDVLHESPGLLVVQRVPDAPLSAAAAPALVAAAHAISVAEPPEDLRVLRTWRDAPHRSLPLRVLRAVAGRMPLAEFLRVRAEAAALPRRWLAHGDFRAQNLLWNPTAGQTVVIDWEFLAPAPEGTDLLMLWSEPVDERLRAVLLDRALDQAEDPRAVAVLAHWLALRRLADLATGPASSGARRRGLEHARGALVQARALRRRLGG